MNKKATGLLAAALTTGLTTFAMAASTVDHADAAFMRDAAQAGAAEIQAAQMAESKNQQGETRTFAQHMIDDHTKVADQLKQLADSKQVQLPDGPSVAQKARLKMIGAGNESKFDDRYARFNVSAHQDAVKLFQKAANNAKDPDVKAFAQQNVATLQHHLEMAQQLASDSAAGKLRNTASSTQ
jgi:putative membrane protein